MQRGHDRQAVFIEAVDYRYYINTLREWKEELKIKTYGCCLMTSHVHLITDPIVQENNLGKLMKQLAGRQTRYVNAKEKRTGSLWEGRCKSSLIETDTYLLACNRYVEINPVNAGMGARAEDYKWSSYRQKIDVEAQWVDSNPTYIGLSREKKQRIQKFTAYIKEEQREEEKQVISGALQRGQLTGKKRFYKQVEQRVGIRVEQEKQGRPRKLRDGEVNHV